MIYVTGEASVQNDEKIDKGTFIPISVPIRRKLNVVLFQA